MNRFFAIISCLLIASTHLSGCKHTAPPTQSISHYTTSATPIGTLLKDPQAAAVIEKQIPGFTTDSRVGMAAGMTLRQVQRFRPNIVTDEKLAAMDLEFAKIPAH
jgi:para-nitrobenzyl esterase